jgi:hypothetical protein
VSFIVCVVLCAVFRLIMVLFCVMCVICLLCLIVNHCHRVIPHLQFINITLHYIFTNTAVKTAGSQFLRRSIGFMKCDDYNFIYLHGLCLIRHVGNTVLSLP